TFFFYIALARAVLTDMMFLMWITASLGFFFQSLEKTQSRGRNLLLGFAFMGGAVLTKGLLGLTFIMTAVVLYAVWIRQTDILKDKYFWFGVGLFSLMVVPWHVLMYIQHGDFFIQEYFQNVHTRRLFEAEHPKLDNGFFYFILMLIGVFPWSMLWVPGVMLVIAQFKRQGKHLRALKYCICWIISVLLYTQPATSKLASYIFPLFPAIALIFGLTVDHLLEKSDGHDPRTFKWIGRLFPLFILAVCAAGIFIAKEHHEIIYDMRPLYLGCFLFILTGIFILTFHLKRQYVKMLFSFIGIHVALLISLFFMRPMIEPWVSCKAICDVFNTIDQSDAPIIASKFYLRGVRYYTQRPVALIDVRGKGFWSPHPIPYLISDGTVKDFLKMRNINYAIIKKGDSVELKRILKGHPYKLEELAGIGGKYIYRITKTH
ncbi:MAG: phospholipid carrier-dependent glycosyltransferase, partial [Candidatus Omnitrophica bacterium]|nr:phospholipid carrier-dependent glycosyltransferase [Candidatus Omnitrophota bacterium]